MKKSDVLYQKATSFNKKSTEQDESILYRLDMHT